MKRINIWDEAMLETEKCQKKTDQELVLLALKDQEYFLCLVKRYQDKLTRYIRRISSFSKEETEDILQEVFIKVYQNLNGFDQDLKFSSWIYRICHNQVISSYRKTKIRPKTVSLDSENFFFKNLSADLDLEREISSKELKETFDRILSGMDIKYREVLILRFLEGKDYKEISDILKKPIGTVSTLINRAKKKFKEDFKNHE